MSAATIAGLVLVAAVVGLALLVIALAWDHQPKARHAARREPLGVRHDRLDAEALRATSRPSSSNRKAGRATGGIR